ncbi:MAG: hypothetical protein KC731_07865 [Myxococcales bacterium]|nr:hypothetical protein [Myxococcales bacterium]
MTTRPRDHASRMAPGIGRLGIRLLGSMLLLGGLACLPSADGAQSPAATLQAYSLALDEGRADDAYRLLSKEARRSLSIEAFRRLVAENPEEVRDIAKSLARHSSPPVVRATITSPGGEQLSLIYEGGRWTVDGTGIDRYGQATPRQALTGFLRAYDRKRFDVLMRYVPDAEREGRAADLWGGEGEASVGLTADVLKKAWTGDQKEYIAGIVQAIKSAMPTARIEETEDRAAMPYGAGGTVLFLRENGLWKIEDLK